MDNCKDPATTLDQIKAIIAAVLAPRAEKGVRNVYCVACGGSFACFYPMEYFLTRESEKLTVHCVTANEFVYAPPKALGEDTVVFAMSLGGGTKETIAAVELAKKAGASTIALTSSYEAPIAKVTDQTVIYRIDIGTPADEQNQYMILALAVELLAQTEGYAHYAQAIESFGKVRLICDNLIKKIQPACDKFGVAHCEEPVIYTVASGASARVAYMQSICLFMEMEWMNSSSIHSAEYFHGPFEITEPGVCFMIFINDGPTRALDERALAFMQRYSGNVTVIDSKELGISIIDDAVVEYFNPIIHWAAGIEYAQGLAKAKKHPLLQRRYMGKISY